MAPISIVICTHNPRADYLREVLEGLKHQTLPASQWELLVIDNASDQAVEGRINLSWHPAARIVREETLGLTAARLRGIRETTGELLVFVDDDNVLDADYLEQTLTISQAWPILGAWGGQTLPRFEVEPPKWIESYWGHLALRRLDRDLWSNQRNGESAPIGAGLVVRRQVALVYASRLGSDQKRSGLDRTGTSLTSGGDTDLALTAVDIGFGTGLFMSLKLTHLISADRLTESHLAKLQEGLSYSATILNSIRGLPTTRPHRSFLTRVHEWGHLFLRTDRLTRRIELASRRGAATAERALRNGSRPN
jgi:glycosyltransferase involved in cell wall biosynthesis